MIYNMQQVYKSSTLRLDNKYKNNHQYRIGAFKH